MGKQSWKPGNMLNPVPAVMVSCADREGKPNIITIAWAGTVCTNPPMVSISVRPTRYSYDMIRETGEFVINLVTEPLTRACDYCGVVRACPFPASRKVRSASRAAWSRSAPSAVIPCSLQRSWA